MNLFKTSGIEFINLDQVTRFECEADRVTLHFGGEDQMTLRNDDAKKLAHILAGLAGEFDRRVPKN